MARNICHWGILGTAKIARKNWHSIWNSGNGKLIAVASRNRERAAQYIGECQSYVPFTPAPQATTYDELLDSPDIDAVYIPLPTALRKPWVLRAAAAGKHVLSEKPCGTNAADVSEMLAACRKHNVQFMDGVMFGHSARLPQVRAVLDDGTSVGEIQRIYSHFSFLGAGDFLAANIRANGDLEPLGCLGDLGWYNIRFSLWVMKNQLPERVSARELRATKRSGSTPSVPLEFTAELYFPGGVSAGFYCSFVSQMQQWAHVTGSKGRIAVQDFVLPYYGSEVKFDVFNDVFAATGCQFNFEEHRRTMAVPEYSNNAPASQEANMFRRFGELVLSGKPDPSWGELVLQTQQVLDACLKSARADGQAVGV